MHAINTPKLRGYEILRQLGRGAHGSVHLARQRATRMSLAVKHLPRRDARDDRFLRQAETELRVSRTVTHPTIRKCHAIVRERRWLRTRRLYLLMEYVDGPTLEQHRSDSLAEIVDVFTRVAGGLQALHAAGFVHADLKPSNILIDRRSGEVKVIDLGQASPIGAPKERIQGTPDYMAPEQIHRAPLDERTDIFNLGATMYTLLTGTPFRTEMPSTGDHIALETARSDKPPHVLNKQVPPALSRLVMECCAAARGDRPKDMRVVIERLRLARAMLDRRQVA